MRLNKAIIYVFIDIYINANRCITIVIIIIFYATKNTIQNVLNGCNEI